MMNSIELKEEKEGWFSKELVQDIPNTKVMPTAFNFKNVLSKLVTKPYNRWRLEKVIEAKIDVNKILAKRIISNVLDEIESNSICVNKMGVDYVAPVIYFWFEIKDLNVDLRIKELISKINVAFAKSEFKIEYFTTQMSLDIGIPEYFISLKE
jgi:hypothetical protein